ncbi:hypothetical protein [Streptomyces aureocirculatus]|uniref:hypothetical protein n=1 Tax=Streptomyces aureocirculatus TaxID=67275 RepID=UPI00068D5D9B|nr:hypothetical protein [Streptomyces aureocirculatus]
MTRGGRSGSDAPPGHIGASAAAAVAVLLLLAVVVRLPWAGDLGIHAATLERLRHDPLHPGDPLVDADVPSPYYSPWTVLLGCLAKATGLGVFAVLRFAALAGLALLLTGIRRFVRTLTPHRAAVPLALLCVLFLWGPSLFAWSGFLGLNSLALTVSYPSTFALGLAFHLWACLREALRADTAGPAVFLALGALWAVVLLTHQFTGVVASLGALALLLGARPWPRRATLLRLGAGLALGLALLAAWPYYPFFDLFGAGGGLEEIHRALYRDLPARFGLALVGVAALALRFRRDRRDPLVLFFALGALVFAAGGLSGHYSWGRVLPAALLPAQIAAGVEAAGLAAVRGGRVGRALAAASAGTLTLALAVGAWTQAGTLGYVLPRAALPAAVAAKYRPPWPGHRWITPHVRYGDVVLAKTFPARRLPAYGAYTVAPGYPDFFLPDEDARAAAVRRYFAPKTPRAGRLEVLRRYGVRWVVAYRSDGGLPGSDPALRKVATGPRGQVLYEVLSPSGGGGAGRAAAAEAQGRT